MSVRVQFLSSKLPELTIPPPVTPAPLQITIESIKTFALLEMENTPPRAPPSTVIFDGDASMLRFVEMLRPVPVRTMRPPETSEENVIVSPSTASTIACHSEPGPLVTSIA